METRTSPRAHSRTGKDPSTALLHRHDDGTIHAQSTGTAPVVYVVTIGERMSCTCHAGKRGITCYHQLGAAQRFPAFWPRPTHVIVPESTEPEPPSPAAPAVRCFTCGDVLDTATAVARADGFFNHLSADWDACRLHVLTVRRLYRVAA